MQGMKDLKVNNIFYSVQGEGNHTGEASIFIRLSNCNLRCRYCDTDYVSGINLSLEQILERLPSVTSKRIVWTGGEPLLQLNSETVRFFNDHGYLQSIETNGSIPPPLGLDYIAISPKTVSLKKLGMNFEGRTIGEFRYLIGTDSDIPKIRCVPPEIKNLPKASFYYVSPLFVGERHKKFELDQDNLKMAIDFVKADPRWRLSVQNHKIWNVP